MLDFVDNEIFPLELPHTRLDYLLCELGTGTLKGLVVHLSEGANNDSSAHREFTMVDKEKLLRPGVVIIHGTAVRSQDFSDMANNNVGLIWSPRSNDGALRLDDEYSGGSCRQRPRGAGTGLDPSGSLE